MVASEVSYVYDSLPDSIGAVEGEAAAVSVVDVHLIRAGKGIGRAVLLRKLA